MPFPEIVTHILHIGSAYNRKQPPALTLIAQKRTVNVNSHIICVKKSASGTNISSEKLA